MVHSVLRASLVLATLACTSATISQTYLKFETAPMTQALCDTIKAAEKSKTGSVTDTLVCTTDGNSYIVMNPKSVAGPGATVTKTGTDFKITMDFSKSDLFSFRVVSHADQVIQLVKSWSGVVMGATFWAKEAENSGKDLSKITPVMSPTISPTGVRIWGEPMGPPTLLAKQNTMLKVSAYDATAKSSKMEFEVELAQVATAKGKESSFSEITAPWAFPPAANSGPITWSFDEGAGWLKITKQSGILAPTVLAKPTQYGCNKATAGANTVPAMTCLAKAMQDRMFVPPTANNLCNIHRGIVGCYVNNSCVGEEVQYCGRADVSACKLSICPKH